tara:strand:+ start:464 stop:616 length:153 start_codon:yes stop_codon:yes gene_type:complete
MREEKTTEVSIYIELQGKKVVLSKDVPDHDLEDKVVALLNSALLLEQNLE